MNKLDAILLEFLQTMLSDLKRRSYDESGEQKAETLGRVETLKNLIYDLKMKETD